MLIIKFLMTEKIYFNFRGGKPVRRVDKTMRLIEYKKLPALSLGFNILKGSEIT